MLTEWSRFDGTQQMFAPLRESGATEQRRARAAAAARRPVAAFAAFMAVTPGGPMAACPSPATTSGWIAGEGDTAIVGHTVKSWPRPCEEMFEWMSRFDFAELTRLIRGRHLEDTELTFAAEALALCSDLARATKVLKELVEDDRSIVREGAYLGLAQLWHERKHKPARSVLRNAQRREGNPTLRELLDELLLGA